MPNLKGLRSKIKNIKSTQKITSAMKLVATAHLKKFQTYLKTGTPYSEGIVAILNRVVAGWPEDEFLPLPLVGRPLGCQHLLLVVGGDRGLCGNFNALILKSFLKEKHHLETQGKQVKTLGLGKRLPVCDHFFELDYRTPYPSLFPVINYMYEAIESGRVDSCSLMYTHFDSPISYAPKHVSLVPFPVEPVKDSLDLPAKEILPKLVHQNLMAQLFFGIINSKASEEGARMVAMDNATNNAKERLQFLDILYNRTRQAMITKELIEIISGAEAI